MCARCLTRQHYADERRKEKRIAVKQMRHMKEHLAAVESHYRREVVEKDLKEILQQMVKSAKFPCSDWLNEYLHCVVS